MPGGGFSILPPSAILVRCKPPFLKVIAGAAGQNPELKLFAKSLPWTKRRRGFTERPHKKSVKKIVGRALRNEIDVTQVWSGSWSVSPTVAGFYSHVVTYFILDLHTIFSLFLCSLDFLFLFYQEKRKTKHEQSDTG